MINYLIGTDVGRAKLTLQEILHNVKQMSHSVDEIAENMNSFSSSDKPLKEQLEAYLNEFKQKHTKIKITASVETPDPNISYHPVFNINFMRLIAIFFDNIALHANASNVSVQASLTPNMAEVILTDDGVGIKDTYMEDSPWYSSLHKAKEILYMLCGKLDISGDVMSGTTVKFSFPIQQ
jgi:histidine kinase-, DNA gyrase B-, and HSP90-like ATPase